MMRWHAGDHVAADAEDVGGDRNGKFRRQVFLKLTTFRVEHFRLSATLLPTIACCTLQTEQTATARQPISCTTAHLSACLIPGCRRHSARWGIITSCQPRQPESKRPGPNPEPRTGDGDLIRFPYPAIDTKRWSPSKEAFWRHISGGRFSVRESCTAMPPCLWDALVNDGTAILSLSVGRPPGSGFAGFCAPPSVTILTLPTSPREHAYTAGGHVACSSAGRPGRGWSTSRRLQERNLGVDCS